MKLPMITVFTSCYNQAEYLQACIDSVLNQTFTDFEYQLIDDGSTDDTFDIMMRAAKRDKRIIVTQLSKKPNVGHVINISAKMSRGDYWTWCPADDKLTHNCLELSIAAANVNPGHVLYHDFFIIGDDDNDIRMSVVTKYMTPDEFNEEVWKTSPIGFTGILIPTQTLIDLPFPEHLQFSEDFYWMIHATLHGIKFTGIRNFLHFKRKHINTNTAHNLPAILKQVHVIRKELRDAHS